jgi:hypothetical protein
MKFKNPVILHANPARAAGLWASQGSANIFLDNLNTFQYFSRYRGTSRKKKSHLYCHHINI